MVSNSAVKKNKLTFAIVSETGRFQNIYHLISYFRVSSKKSVDITIQHMIKFDVLSASFIFLLTLFSSFKARYKKEIYSFLIGQNLPGITNLSQKPFRETSKYVVALQDESFLGKSQFYFDTNFIEHNLPHFYQNGAIKLGKKQTLFEESLIFNGKTIENSYHIKHNNHFRKEGKFLPSIYNQVEFFNKNKTKTTSSKPNLSSPYHLAFQSFTAKNFAFSAIKKFEKEGTYLKSLELPLKCDSFFGIFQKKDVTAESNGIRQNLFKLPKKTGSAFYKQNETITKNLFEKDQKNWFCLGQNGLLQTQLIGNQSSTSHCIEDQLWPSHQWFSLYKNNLSKKQWNNLRDKKSCDKLKTQPILLNELFSIFYNVNNLSKSHTLSSTILDNSSLTNLNNFVKQDVSKMKKAPFTSRNWWDFIFSKGFSLNSNFIINNLDLPFSQFTKDPVLIKQKEETPLRKEKRGLFYKKSSLDQKWKEKNYNQYLQLDEFPSKLSSILPSQILTGQSFTKTKDEILDFSQKKEKFFRIKHKFILRGSKSNLNLFASQEGANHELGFIKENSLNLKSKSTISVNSKFFEDNGVKDLDSKFRQLKEAENSSLNRQEKTSFLQEKTNPYYINKYLKERVSFPKLNLAEKNQSKTFYLSPKSAKFCLLKNEIKTIFSSCKNDSYFLEKEKKTFNLLSDKLLTSLDQILLGSSNSLQGKNQASRSETLDSLLEFLPQKICSPSHIILQNIDKNKENLELKHTKKFTQLLQDFWSKKEEVSHKENSDFSMKNLVSTEQKLRKNSTGKIRDNWFPFFIKYLSVQPRLMSGYQFPDLNRQEIEKLIKYSDCKKVLINKTPLFKFQNYVWSIFPQISKKGISQQHPIDVYLPNKLSHNKPKNVGMLCLQPQTKALEKLTFFENKGLDQGDFYLKPLKFISKSLRLENNTEKQSLFVYQIPAVLKISPIWNPRLQKLQITKNKSKYPASSTDFLKNLLSSTNSLTDRKQYFFAIGNQVERELENSFIQRPLSGSLFGLFSSNLVNKRQTNLQNRSLFPVKLQDKGFSKAELDFGKESLPFAKQAPIGGEFKGQDKNFNLIKKDFSILPLLSKVTPSFYEGKTNPLDKNSLEETSKAQKPFLVSSKMYKTYPKSFKPINGINFYSFLDVSPFHFLKTLNIQGKTEGSLSNCLSNYDTFTNLTQNNLKFNRLPLTKKILENSKLNIKQKQLSDKCDKQINTLQLALPFLDTETFNTTWTKWLSSRYKKPSISYRFQKKVFYLPSNEKIDFFLQQKNRYQKNKWGEVEQQENRLKKVEKEEDSLRIFSEQVYLPLTIKRSIRLPNRLNILQSKNSKFSFFTTKPLLSQSENKQLKGLTLNNFPKKDKISILPYKKLSFLPKSVWQEQDILDTFFLKNTKENSSCLLGGKESSVTQISPLSYFLSDKVEKNQMPLSYLKRLDTNCDRLDWQFCQWHPFLNEKYVYLPPSQSILNEEFLNNFFKNKIRKRNTIYKYSKHLPILRFHYVKSKGLKNLLPKISTLQGPSFPKKVRNSQNQVSRGKTNESLNMFRKAYSFSHLQNKESSFNILFPKKKRIEICWEPITIRSWMVVTQYCYAFFLVQSALYVYEKHMKKVLLSFAPLLSGRGILSGMPSFGEKLQDFLGGSTIDKNVLLFKKIPKRFQDIVAIDNKLPQLSEIVWFLRNFGRTANVNKIQGVLFVGPPGTGKTLLVQAIAGEAEVPVLVLSGSSFADGKKDKKGGQLLKRVFQRARILAPSILFIDEIDTLGESRSHFAQDDRDQKNESSRIIESISHTEEKIQGRTPFLQNRKKQSVKQVGLLTQFLVEMDGLARQQKNSYFLNSSITFKKPGGILVIGSTNRPKVLDPALTRPGRFDQVFYLSNPGKQRRIDILKVYTKNIGVSTSLPWNYLAERTLGFSAADLSAIVNKSTIQAILSHTIHTIQSIENGIESLPRLLQNQSKLFNWQENDISNSFLFLESQKYNNGNTILCKSIFTSLSTCVKHLNLQNKYTNLDFWADQPKSDQNSVFKFLQETTTLAKSDNSGKSKEGLQQSFSNFSLQEKKGSVKSDYSKFLQGKNQVSRSETLKFPAKDFAFTKENINIGMSFLNRLPFYQAGKVMVQILVSKDSIDGRSVVAKPPMILVATLWPKQEFSFSNMFKESIHVKEVTNRNQLETRLTSGYAGKAAETLLISGLQFYKNNETRVTWQSTLGVEEWKLTNSLAYLMISKYYFYSQKGPIQKENLIALSQNSNEILETENFQILQNIFFKEESTFSQEKQHFELAKGKNDIINTIGENKSLLNPIIWISNLCPQYEITKIFGHIEENNWYQVYLPPFVKDEQNKEWVPLDQYYFGRENLIELVWNTYKNKFTNWSDIYQLDYDLTYQGLVLYHFNKALSLLDRNRELLDLFANLLISFQTIRRHEILKALSYFKYYDRDFLF